MIRVCADCPMNSQDAVQGIGPKRAHIMFLGESPGQNEVNEGRPFSPNGKSGQLLHAMLDDLGSPATQHYFDNVAMCPGKISASKAEACSQGLWDRVDEIRPRLIVPMGNVAAKAIASYRQGISKVRAQYREVELEDGERIGVLPTYHPAAILRVPDNFRDFEKDIRKAVGIADEGKPAVVPPPYKDYHHVHTPDDFWRVLPEIEAAKFISVDLETLGDFINGDVWVAGIGYGRGKSASISWDVFKEDEDAFEAFKLLLETKRNAYQNAMFDLAWLWQRDVFPNLWFDTMVGHWLLDERATGHGLEAMAIEYYAAPPYKSNFRKRWGLGSNIKDDDEFAGLFGKIPVDAVMAYNNADCDYTWRLAADIRKQIRAIDKESWHPLQIQGMLDLSDMLMEATSLYTDLLMEGINIDVDHLDRLEAELVEERDQLAAELEAYTADVWLPGSNEPGVNPRSPKQLAVYLFDVLELESIGGVPADGKEISQDVLSSSLEEVDDEEAQLYWKTSRPALFGGTGQIEKGEGLSSRSSGTFMLYWLAQQHEYPRILVKHKKVQKRLTTYIGNVRKHMWPDNRVRPEYKITGHLHGRFRSSNPVIHNLPNERDIYNIYCAPPEYVILSADYQQADLRMIAHFSGDKALAEWLEGDPHAEVVKVIRKLSDEELAALKERNPDEYKRSRLAAKAVNFGLPYGRGAPSLAPQIGVSVREAKLWVKRYWARLPDYKAWVDSRPKELLEAGQQYVGPFGNRRRFPLIISRAHEWKAGSLGINFPIMSSVNYLTTLAHIDSVAELRERGIDAKVYPHIHDSISVAVPIADAIESAKIMHDVMGQIPLDMGFDTIEWPVDVEWGTHWGDKQSMDTFSD